MTTRVSSIFPWKPKLRLKVSWLCSRTIYLLFCHTFSEFLPLDHLFLLDKGSCSVVNCSVPVAFVRYWVSSSTQEMWTFSFFRVGGKGFQLIWIFAPTALRRQKREFPSHVEIVFYFDMISVSRRWDAMILFWNIIQNTISGYLRLNLTSGQQGDREVFYGSSSIVGIVIQDKARNPINNDKSYNYNRVDHFGNKLHHLK